MIKNESRLTTEPNHLDYFSLNSTRSMLKFSPSLSQVCLDQTVNPTPHPPPKPNKPSFQHPIPHQVYITCPEPILASEHVSMLHMI